MRNKKLGKEAILFLAFIVFALLATNMIYAQRLTGKLTGLVLDDENRALPGVTIEISSPALMGTRSLTTKADGEYYFINLPPGIYRAVFKLQGFQTIERQNLRVSVDSTTTENIKMKLITLEESVTITAEAPVVDVTKSGVTTNYSSEMIENLPSGRFNWADIIKQNPGISTADGKGNLWYSAFGSNSEENALYMDGVDLSNPELGTSWLYSTADMFEEVEVKGIGTAAEYGNFTGAVVNIVSKSGGNTFSGSASYYGQFKKLTGDNNPDPVLYNSYKRDRYFDVAFTLGGPVIKDRIWFFSVLQKTDDFESSWQSDPDFPAEDSRSEQYLKFSIQITKSHRLVLSYNHQYKYMPNSPTEFQTPEATAAETNPTHSWNAHYTFLMSNSSFFELKYSGYSSHSYALPIEDGGGDVNNPVHYDLGTGVNSGGVWWPWHYLLNRNTANATISYFAEDFLAGDHDFKAGVQYNRGSVEAWGGYSGGKLYYDFYGENYLRYDLNIWQYGGTVNTIGVFLDDSWKINKRLTVNLGLRFDHHNGYIPSLPIMDGWKETSEKGPRIDNLINWNSWSPRLGFALQLTSDQKTLFRASFGRYFVYPYIANWEWPGPNVSDFIGYFWTGSEWEEFYYLPGEQGYVQDPNLKNPYVDQISVGLTREILPDFSGSLTYLFKNGKENIGYTNIGGIYEEVQRVSPDNGKAYTVFNQNNVGEEEHFLTNPEGWGQKYHGIIFDFNKKYSNRWMMQASLTWSKASGLNLGARANTGYETVVWQMGKVGADPNDLVNGKGYLSLDRRWLFKFSFGYNLPWDILASTIFTYQTGRPRITFVRIEGLNQKPFYPGTSIIAEEKGIGTTLLNGTSVPGRFDDYFMWDIRLQKTFRPYKSWRIQAFLDFFNILNAEMIDMYWSYEAWESNFGEPRQMPLPRRIQVGLKIQF